MTAQTITRPRKSPTQAQADRRPRWLSYPEAAELPTFSVRSLKRLTGGREAAVLRGGRQGAAAQGSRCGGPVRAGRPVPGVVSGSRRVCVPAPWGALCRGVPRGYLRLDLRGRPSGMRSSGKALSMNWSKCGTVNAA